jgi:hypothetical protein
MTSRGQALQHLGSSAPPDIGAGLSLGAKPQMQSDGIVRDVIAPLRIVESQLDGSAARAPHHAWAQASVSQAIHHLEGALGGP